MIEPFSLVLAAEDEESDATLLKLAFKKTGVPPGLVVVRDGQEAVDYLAGAGRYADRNIHPLPRLIVLDLKMPRMSGFDVLDWLGKAPALSKIPAVVLSSSADESDIEKARRLGACDYFVKPQSFNDLIRIIKQIHEKLLVQANAQTESGERVLREFQWPCRTGVF